MAKDSQDFKEKRAIQEMQEKNDLIRHKNNMKELKYRRESEAIHHDHEMTRQRIKSAEIRKNQERKANRDFAQNYYKK